MSAAGREAIAEAQRKRWAAAKGESQAAPKKATNPKRKLSAEGRANIVAALKKRFTVAARLMSLTYLHRSGNHHAFNQERNH